MRLRKQDANGDYQFGHNIGDIWYNQLEGVAQSVITRLLLFTGEWFLDLAEGTPWGGFPLTPAVVRQGRILGAHTALSRDMAIQQRVLATEGVQSISNYTSTGDPSLRNFNVTMTVQTIYGAFALSIRSTPSPPHFLLDWSPLGGADPL